MPTFPTQPQLLSQDVAYPNPSSVGAGYTAAAVGGIGETVAKFGDKLLEDVVTQEAQSQKDDRVLETKQWGLVHSKQLEHDYPTGFVTDQNNLDAAGNPMPATDPHTKQPITITDQYINDFKEFNKSQRMKFSTIYGQELYDHEIGNYHEQQSLTLKNKEIGLRIETDDAKFEKRILDAGNAIGSHPDKMQAYGLYGDIHDSLKQASAKGTVYPTENADKKDLKAANLISLQYFNSSVKNAFFNKKLHGNPKAREAYLLSLMDEVNGKDPESLSRQRLNDSLPKDSKERMPILSNMLNPQTKDNIQSAISSLLGQNSNSYDAEHPLYLKNTITRYEHGDTAKAEVGESYLMQSWSARLSSGKTTPAIIWQELSQVYDAKARGRAPSPELAAQNPGGMKALEKQYKRDMNAAKLKAWQGLTGESNPDSVLAAKSEYKTDKLWNSTIQTNIHQAQENYVEYSSKHLPDMPLSKQYAAGFDPINPDHQDKGGKLWHDNLVDAKGRFVTQFGKGHENEFVPGRQKDIDSFSELLNIKNPGGKKDKDLTHANFRGTQDDIEAKTKILTKIQMNAKEFWSPLLRAVTGSGKSSQKFMLSGLYNNPETNETDPARSQALMRALLSPSTKAKDLKEMGLSKEDQKTFSNTLFSLVHPYTSGLSSQYGGNPGIMKLTESLTDAVRDHALWLYQTSQYSATDAVNTAFRVMVTDQFAKIDMQRNDPLENGPGKDYTVIIPRFKNSNGARVSDDQAKFFGNQLNTFLNYDNLKQYDLALSPNDKSIAPIEKEVFKKAVSANGSWKYSPDFDGFDLYYNNPQGYAMDRPVYLQSKNKNGDTILQKVHVDFNYVTVPHDAWDVHGHHGEIVIPKNPNEKPKLLNQKKAKK